MNIAIIGSRDFDKFEHFQIMNDFIWEKMEDGGFIDDIDNVVSGGAKGADSLGKTWAETYAIPLIEFLPDWKMYGKRAGMIRNADIICNSDIVFAFWDGRSKGTKSSIKISKELHKTLHICLF